MLNKKNFLKSATPRSLTFTTQQAAGYPRIFETEILMHSLLQRSKLRSIDSGGNKKKRPYKKGQKNNYCGFSELSASV